MSISCLVCTDDQQKTESIQAAVRKYCSPELLLQGTPAATYLSAASDFHPQLVVLDLEESFDRVLLFAEQIRALHPEVFLIVFVQFKEFSFAHRSMSLERVEFLPKPWRAEALQESVTRIVNQIHLFRDSVMSSGRLESVVNENIPVIRQHFLSLLMRSGGFNPETVIRKFETFQIDCPGPSYTVVIVDIAEERGKENYEALSFLVLSSMKSMLKTEGYQVYIFFDSEFRINSLIGHERKLQHMSISEVVHRLDEYCRFYLGLQLRFGIGVPVDSVADVHLSFDAAELDLQKNASLQNQYTLLPFQKALDYIDQHFSEPRLSLADVSSYLGFSRSYFSRFFRRYQKEGFSDYLQNKRLTYAVELLSEGKMALSEVASQSGFSSVKYFSTVFRKAKNETPSEFRKRTQKV
ncbi:MAG: helix-turn-helix domain-containing protein [Clostridia bacterium]|nr:helix-turn-helix domain-containing protein [Clostridia bacterium]